MRVWSASSAWSASVSLAGRAFFLRFGFELLNAVRNDVEVGVQEFLAELAELIGEVGPREAVEHDDHAVGFADDAEAARVVLVIVGVEAGRVEDRDLGVGRLLRLEDCGDLREALVGHIGHRGLTLLNLRRVGLLAVSHSNTVLLPVPAYPTSPIFMANPPHERHWCLVLLEYGNESGGLLAPRSLLRSLSQSSARLDAARAGDLLLDFRVALVRHIAGARDLRLEISVAQTSACPRRRPSLPLWPP